MEYFLEFEKQPNQYWIKVIVALNCLRKYLGCFSDKEIGIFHRELVKKCGRPNLCGKKCDFKNWKPRPKEIPPLDCEMCSSWRDLILANHTNPGGKVMWMNSKPDRWSQDKWEVAKVYMPEGHKDHNSIEDFDIAALLNLMNQCKHFKKFMPNGLCENVSNVRNKVMHAASFQLEQKDFLDCFKQMTKFGKVLGKRVPEFKSLAEDLDKIKNLDYRLIFPDDMAAQKIRAQDEKEREDILFDLTTHATAFVKNVRAKHRLSQKDMNDIVAGAQKYQSSLLDNIKKQIEGVLKKLSAITSGQVKKDVMGVFDNFIDPFASVATIKQNSVLKKQFSCLDAEEISNARTICRKKHGGSKDFFIKDQVFHYVPLVKSLEQFLSRPRILSMIEKGPQRCREGFFQDIVDGALLKSHLLFLEKPNPLQIVLYMDEIEICNPLGSFASKNKLMVYYTLGNINPKYRSKLAAIRPLAMARSADLHQSSVDVILNRIKEDTDALHSGVKMQTINGEKTIYGAMVSLCGDTLAQHELAVFKEGVGHECSFEYMQSHFNEDAYTERTLEKHVRHCDKIEKANTDLLRNSLRTTCGINLDSGNSAILGFTYSPLDVRDRPSPISVTTLMSSDGKLKQSSGQMLVPLRILPIVLERLEVKAYVQLIIEQKVFAPVLTIATVSRLKLLIENNFKLWKELFPDRSVTPKKHYMIHLENICKCLINQNQIYESCQNVDPSMHPISLNEREMGPVSEVKDLQYLRGKLRDFLGFNEVNRAVSVKWLVINGNTYITQKSMNLAKVLNGNMPEFGLVENIFLVDSRLYCLVPHLAAKLVVFPQIKSQTFVQVKYHLEDVTELQNCSNDS